jgi:hypothetical protein
MCNAAAPHSSSLPSSPRPFALAAPRGHVRRCTRTLARLRTALPFLLPNPCTPTVPPQRPSSSRRSHRALTTAGSTPPPPSTRAPGTRGTSRSLFPPSAPRGHRPARRARIPLLCPSRGLRPRSMAPGQTQTRGAVTDRSREAATVADAAAQNPTMTSAFIPCIFECWSVVSYPRLTRLSKDPRA